MRPLLLLILLVLQIGTLAGQIQPLFETALYFEDAAGNKDTIVVGLDTMANAFFNPEFGENDIMAPFDSVFEVRATHWSSFGWGEGDYILSKKIVSTTEYNPEVPDCLSGGGILFFIHSHAQPIRIRWEAGTFDTYCTRGTFFTPDRLHQMINPWDWLAMPGIRFGCAAGTDFYEVALGDVYRAPLEISYIAMHEIENHPGVTDSIYGLAFGITESYFISCNQSAAQDLTGNALWQGLKIYPNPAQERIWMATSDGGAIGNIEIVDALGKKVIDYAEQQSVAEIDISRLRFGLYYVMAHSDNSLRQYGKFVKN